MIDASKQYTNKCKADKEENELKRKRSKELRETLGLPPKQLTPHQKKVKFSKADKGQRGAERI